MFTAVMKAVHLFTVPSQLVDFHSTFIVFVCARYFALKREVIANIHV